MDYRILNNKDEVGRLLDGFENKGISRDFLLLNNHIKKYGNPITSCAYNGQEVVACVSAIISTLYYHEKKYDVGVVSIPFLHLESVIESEHVLSNLLKMIEDEVRTQSVVACFSFPSETNVPTFNEMGWTCGEKMAYERVKPVKALRSLFRLSDISKAFNSDYRFIVLDTKGYYAVVSTGNRGRLADAHIVHVTSKVDRHSGTGVLNSIISYIAKEMEVDVVSFGVTREMVGEKQVRGAFKSVLSHPYFCFKMLNNDLKSELV